MKNLFGTSILLMFSVANSCSCHRGTAAVQPSKVAVGLGADAAAEPSSVQGSWKIQQLEAFTKEVAGRYLLHDIPDGQVVLVVAAMIASLGNSTLYSEAISVSTMETAGATFLGVGSGPSLADPRFVSSEVVVGPEGRMDTLEEGTGNVTFGVGRAAGRSYVTLSKKPVHLFMAFAIGRPRESSFTLHFGDTSVTGMIQHTPNVFGVSALLGPVDSKKTKTSPSWNNPRRTHFSKEFRQTLVPASEWLREQDGKVLQATLRINNTSKTTERLQFPLLNSVTLHNGDISKKALAGFTYRGLLAVGMQGDSVEIEVPSGETVEFIYYVPTFQGKATLDVTGLGTSTVEAQKQEGVRPGARL